jgi:hypothetical protein
MTNKLLWRSSIYSAANIGTSYMKEIAVPRMNILIYDIIQMAYEYGMQAASLIPFAESISRYINQSTDGWLNEVLLYVWSIGAQGLFNLIVNGPSTALIDSILILFANYMGNKVKN